MRKPKVRQVNPPPSAAIVGVGWYVPQEWARVKATAIDSNIFEDSFPEWESMATENFELMRKHYPKAMKVFIAADEFFAWCHLRMQTNSAKARAEFVAEKLQATASPAPANPSRKN